MDGDSFSLIRDIDPCRDSSEVPLQAFSGEPTPTLAVGLHLQVKSYFELNQILRVVMEEREKGNLPTGFGPV